MIISMKVTSFLVRLNPFIGQWMQYTLNTVHNTETWKQIDKEYELIKKANPQFT